MSVFYPQGCITLGVVFENFDGSQQTTQQLQANPLNVYTFTMQAKNISVQINDYLTADTFTAEIDFKQFPFDPRAIRNCKVDIAMQDMGSIYNADGTPNQIVPTEDNINFQGFVDEDSIEFDENKRIVKLEGRDFTGLFLDTVWTGKTINTDLPLDVLIKNIIAGVPTFNNISVVNLTGVSPLPALASFAPDFNDPQEQKINAHPNASYWDIIQDLVVRAALICYIAIDELIITSPRVLYNESQALRMVYGSNLTDLEFKRKLGRKKGFNIAVRSYDFTNKAPVLAKIPLKATAAWLKAMNLQATAIQIPQINTDGSPGTSKDAPYTSFRFQDMTLAQAISKGQDIFEQMGRQQMEGSLTTRDMQFPQVTGPCVSAFDFEVGTAIKIEILQDDLKRISQIEDPDTRYNYLINQGFSNKVAQALSQSLGKFSLTFYTKSVELSIEEDQGFKMKVNFINYIQIENKNLT